MKKLFGVIVVVVIVMVVVLVQVVKYYVMGGCSVVNLEKMEIVIEVMVDGDSKLVVQKEIVFVQDVLLGGKMGVCGVYFSKVMYVMMSK